MLGRMQDWPLLMHKVIDFAAVQFPEQQVASRTVEGPMHYTNYREVRERALKVANDSSVTESSSAIASRRWPGTAIAISKPGMASSAPAGSITPSIRGSSPSKSPGS
jgi:hypothetical protein